MNVDQVDPGGEGAQKPADGATSMPTVVLPLPASSSGT
jgi:hypothetical protein